MTLMLDNFPICEEAWIYIRTLRIPWVGQASNKKGLRKVSTKRIF